MKDAAGSGFVTPCGSGVALDTAFGMLEIAAVSCQGVATGVVAGALGLAVPPRPGHAAGNRKVQLFHAAPRRWLMRTNDAAAPLPDIPGCAVTDISDGLVCLQARGETVRAWLSQHCPLDVRPRVFGGHRIAWTRFADVHALLHCVAADAFDIYVGASYAGDVIERCLSNGTGSRAG